MQPPNDVQRDLQLAFEEATKQNGLIELLAELRASTTIKYKVKKDRIYSIFSNCPLWEEEKTKNGHVKFKHKITQICIGYQNHGSTTVDPGGVVALLDQVQDHLNILSNHVFKFSANHWKTAPDYAQAEANLAAWKGRI